LGDNPAHIIRYRVAVPDNPTPIAPIPAPDAIEHAPPAAVDLSPAGCAARLGELFPAPFGSGPPRPLKLRIQADVQQRAPGVFTKKTLSIFLQRYTTSTAYLKALVMAPHRVDLDGAAAGEVAAEHRQAASAELARRREIHDARRAAERDAQRKAHDDARRAREVDDVARGERAALLRAFETTTLTRANFCALKALPEADLDARLAQARLEREQRAPAPRADRPVARPGARDPRPVHRGAQQRSAEDAPKSTR